MKKVSFTTCIPVTIFVLILHIQVTFSQLYNWELNANHIYYRYGNVGIGDFSLSQPSYNLHVLGNMFSTGNVYGANGNTFISSDPNGAIEVGFNNSHSKTPYIDFHWGTLFGGQDFNARIINSGDNILDIVTNNGQKLTFNGTPSGYYNLPSLRLTNTAGEGNSFEFQSQNGLSAIDFWNFGGQNAVIDFFADYQNHPEYNQFSVKRDENYGNSCGWGNDESWLAGDRVYLGATTQGPSIHLNQAGSNGFTQPYISFSYGITGNENHNDAVLKNTGTNKLGFFTNTDKFGEGGTQVMTVNNSYVGIGTDNPLLPLHISTGLQIGTSSTANQNFHIVAHDWSGNWGLRLYYGNNGAGTHLVTFSNNGCVGIGVPVPDANYKLSVNGSIRTKEVKVESNWSDFVFKPEYKLTSLEDVEKYIKENGHLEGMPTEQDVKENGVELGDATSKLLQKIEELTLYVIEQNKEIQRLKEENSKMK